MSLPEILMVGIPYEGRGNFLPGTRDAPKAIRGALESIETYSPYQKRGLPEFKDLGDLKMEEGEPEKVLGMLKEEIGELLTPGRRALFLGGDHTISWATILAYQKIYRDLRVVHMDAHLDRRDTFKGEKLNHATFMRRLEESLGRDRILSLGVRSCAPEEEALYSQHIGVNAHLRIEEIGDHPIYLTLDVDVMNPSEFPAVGNPEPGGLSFAEVLRSVLLLKGNLIGADIVEVNPKACPCHYPLVTAALLLREILIALSYGNEVSR